MVQPPGFSSSNKTLVCRLNKALYGLKQAPCAWYERHLVPGMKGSILLYYSLASSQASVIHHCLPTLKAQLGSMP